jgi:RNA polymerase sigma-70 factor, ECF subfamily
MPKAACLVVGLRGRERVLQEHTVECRAEGLEEWAPAVLRVELMTAALPHAPWEHQYEQRYPAPPATPTPAAISTERPQKPGRPPRGAPPRMGDRSQRVESELGPAPSESEMASVGDDHHATPMASATVEEVYRTHFRFVSRTLLSLRVRDADLLDLAQNVFIIVHRQLPSFEGRSALNTWLYSICKRVARDYRRSAPFRREILVDERQVAQRGALSDGMLHRLHSRELSELLLSILDKIPDKLREVFLMFELDELSGDEIARLLNIPVGTARSRLRLARAAFQRQVSLLRGQQANLCDGVAAPADSMPRAPARRYRVDSVSNELPYCLRMPPQSKRGYHRGLTQSSGLGSDGF